MERRILIRVAVTACLLVTSAQALTLTPGTVLGGDSVAPGGTSLTLVKYSQASGAILETLALNTAPVPGFGTLSGVTLIGGNVYIAGSNGIISQVNLTTGDLISASAITTGLSAEGLGNIGGDLLIAAGSGTVRRYSTSGSLLATITLSAGSGLRGIDSDGTQLFAAWNNGLIRVFNLAGTQTGTISTGLSGSTLSGLGYDHATGNLWVSTGFNDDDIRGYTQAGALVNSFSAGFPFINGLDVVPEPASLLLLSPAALFLARRRSGS